MVPKQMFTIAIPAFSGETDSKKAPKPMAINIYAKSTTKQPGFALASFASACKFANLRS